MAAGLALAKVDVAVAELPGRIDYGWEVTGCPTRGSR